MPNRSIKCSRHETFQKARLMCLVLFRQQSLLG